MPAPRRQAPIPTAKQSFSWSAPSPLLRLVLAQINFPQRVLAAIACNRPVADQSPGTDDENLVGNAQNLLRLLLDDQHRRAEFIANPRNRVEDLADQHG